jgi:cell wall-associated NlpC family hydrolase
MTDRLTFLGSLIGLPYRVGATGPDAYDCYGLAQHVQRHLYDVEMPALPYVAATTRQQAEAMMLHPERLNWREVPDAEARDGDLVLMGNVAKRDFHLGVFVVPVTAGVVLHVDQGRGVVADDLPALRAIGFAYARLFRRVGTGSV